MRKLMALLTVLMLALGRIAALAEAESIEVPALAPTDGDMALDGLALDDVDIGEVELGDIADLKLPEADVLLPEEGKESPVDTANDGERVEINSTNFPDKEFRNYVKAAYDLDGDGALSDGERLPVDFMRIGYDESCVLVKCLNMKGLQFFPNLASLFVAGTEEEPLPLKSVDLSANTSLTSVVVMNTNLTSLDVTANEALTEITLINNPLATLKLGKHSKLQSLVCDHNKLTALDVTGCPSLVYLGCDNNKLTALNLSKNTNLVNLHCGKNKLKTIDVSKCRKLQTLYSEANAITKVDIAKLPSYLRNLARNSGYEVEDGLLYNIPEEDKGFCFDASIQLYDGSKRIYPTA